ncbi:MAG TPA: PaaI family thioesterase [Xanthobacteraceae bacterium]|nr:PaaI family thioesterase [Xanthobacteraceae bacterium]
MTASSSGKRFGVIDDNQRRAMTGLEFVQGLVNGTLPLNPMAETLGYDIVEASKGSVVVSAEPHEGHRNPSGTVHGGLAATLLDSCMGLAIQSMLDKGFGQTTLEFKISLVRPITPETGLVRAEGRSLLVGAAWVWPKES